MNSILFVFYYKMFRMPPPPPLTATTLSSSSSSLSSKSGSVVRISMEPQQIISSRSMIRDGLVRESVLRTVHKTLQEY